MHRDEEGITEFQRTLLHWYRTNARNYPWRSDRTAYRTAIAELMLRRTRADQVVPVFESFIAAYPTLEAAAAATPDEVEQMLYPLGLSWRAKNITSFLREAVERFGSNVPLNVDDLRTLPGIGDYVGAAIVCFAGEQSEPLIDTNVVRVLGRIFGLRTEGEARRRSEMRRLAAAAVYRHDPATYHYAILDFAAKVCVARAPRCELCPFSTSQRCAYYRTLREQTPTS